MATAKRALRKPLSIPAKSRFVGGSFIRTQFDGGSKEGHGTGQFVILDGEGCGILQMGAYYGASKTNNEAEMFVAHDLVAVLVKLSS